MTMFLTAALTEGENQLDMTLNQIPVCLQIPSAQQKCDAKGYTSKMMSELRKNEPDIQLHAIDGTAVQDDAAIPSNSITFDKYFKCRT